MFGLILLGLFVCLLSRWLGGVLHRIINFMLKFSAIKKVYADLGIEAITKNDCVSSIRLIGSGLVVGSIILAIFVCSISPEDTSSKFPAPEPALAEYGKRSVISGQ